MSFNSIVFTISGIFLAAGLPTVMTTQGKLRVQSAIVCAIAMVGIVYGGLGLLKEYQSPPPHDATGVANGGGGSGGNNASGGGGGAGAPGGNGGTYIANQINNFRPEESPTPSPSVPSLNPPLRFMCGPTFTPLSIGPSAVLFVAFAHPSISMDGFDEERSNNTAKTQSWPPKEDIRLIKGRSPKQSIVSCVVINNGDHDVIDLELNFGFHFCDTPPTRTSRRVHGYFEADISPTPFLILASINRRIIAPAILPNKSFAFFLVNATGYIVTVDYPSTALGLVSGESTKRLIELIPPNEMGQ
jgi:hypothetical protein